MSRILMLLALIALPSLAHAAPAATSAADCDGWPRFQATTLPGLCLGLVLQPENGAPPSKRLVKLPRALLPLAGGDWLVSDLGGWDAGRGAVWRLTPDPAGPPRLKRLLGGLDLPQTLALGPDGRIYLGLMGRIVRFDPDALDPAASLETVVGGLPDNRQGLNRHPLAGFLFDDNGDLLVDVGAPSDACLPAGEVALPGQRCLEGGPETGAAAVRRYPMLEPGLWSQTPSLEARGLRNSLALAKRPGGVLLQGENSVDLPDAARPFDELNLLRPGRDYGWPYCLNRRTPNPAWKPAAAMDCGRPEHAAPSALLPPHGAPLSMIYYDGPLKPLAGRLLVALHGYRPSGGRVVAVSVDAKGAPVAARRSSYAVYEGEGERQVPYPAGAGVAARTVAGGWDAVRRRPLIAAAGLAAAPDGAVWIADDVNGRILRLAADR